MPRVTNYQGKNRKGALRLGGYDQMTEEIAGLINICANISYISNHLMKFSRNQIIGALALLIVIAALTILGLYWP